MTNNAILENAYARINSMSPQEAHDWFYRLQQQDNKTERQYSCDDPSYANTMGAAPWEGDLWVAWIAFAFDDNFIAVTTRPALLGQTPTVRQIATEMVNAFNDFTAQWFRDLESRPNGPYYLAAYDHFRAMLESMPQ